MSEDIDAAPPGPTAFLGPVSSTLLRYRRYFH